MIDPCAGDPHTCIAVQLSGSGAIRNLDTVSIRVLGGGIDETKPNGLGGRSFSLPAAIAIVLPSVTSKSPISVAVDAVGSLQGKPVGGGAARATIGGGQHTTVNITLTPNVTTLPPSDMAVADAALTSGDLAGTCQTGFHVCNGSCVDDTNLMTCGSSCTPCPADPNATSISCDGTSCVPTCQSGYHACGGVCASNTDPKSCNQSCTPCTVPTGGSATCDGTQCGGSCPTGQKLCFGACIASSMSCVGSCPSGTHDCSGLCDDNTSVNSCGSSCTPCSVPTNGDHATCSSGSCGFVCSSGYKQCGTACIPMAACCSMTDCTQPMNGVATCDGTSHMCVISCNNTFTKCNGSCVNTSGDTSNCGSCGNTCSTSETCTSSNCMCGANPGCAGNVTCMSGGTCTCTGTSLSCTTGGTCCIAVKGFDVSHYQGVINWTTIGAGQQFAIAYVTNGAIVDSQFTNNWSGIKSAGLVRGGALLFDPATDAATQANAFVNAVTSAGYLPSDFFAVDFENFGGQSSSMVLGELMTILQTIQTKTGHMPIIYTGTSLWNPLNAGTMFSSYALWDASYSTNCPTVGSGFSGWTFWQNSGNGTVNGVTPIDTDYFNGTPADLQKFLTNQASGMGFSSTLCGHG